MRKVTLASFSFYSQDPHTFRPQITMLLTLLPLVFINTSADRYSFVNVFVQVGATLQPAVPSGTQKTRSAMWAQEAEPVWSCWRVRGQTKTHTFNAHSYKQNSRNLTMTTSLCFPVPQVKSCQVWTHWAASKHPIGLLCVSVCVNVSVCLLPCFNAHGSQWWPVRVKRLVEVEAALCSDDGFPCWPADRATEMQQTPWCWRLIWV